MDKKTKVEIVKVKPKYVAQQCPGCGGRGTCGYDRHTCPSCEGKGYLLIEAEEVKK